MSEREEESEVYDVNRARTAAESPSPNGRRSMTIEMDECARVSCTEFWRSMTTKQIFLRVGHIRRRIFPSDTTPSAREKALMQATKTTPRRYSIGFRRRTMLAEGFSVYRDTLWEEFFDLQTWRITRPYLALLSVLWSLFCPINLASNLVLEDWSVLQAMLRFLISLTTALFIFFFLWIDARYYEPQLKKSDSQTAGLRKIRKYGLIICIAYFFFVFILTSGPVWQRIFCRQLADYRASWFSLISSFLSIAIVFLRFPMNYSIFLQVFVFVVYFVAGSIAEAPYMSHIRVILFELTCTAIVIFTITCTSYRSECITRYIFSKPAQREIQELHASANKKSNAQVEVDGNQRSSSQSLIYGMPLMYHEQLLIETYVGGRYSLYFNDKMEEFSYQNEVFQSIRSSVLMYIAGAFMVVVLIIDGCLPLALVYSKSSSSADIVKVLVVRIAPCVVIFICFGFAIRRNDLMGPEASRRESYKARQDRGKLGNDIQGLGKTMYDRILIALSNMMHLKYNMVHMNTALPSALILIYIVYIMITWDVILQEINLLPEEENTGYFRLPLVTSLTSCGIMILRLSFAHAMVFVLSVFSVYISIWIILIIILPNEYFATFAHTKIIMYEVIAIATNSYVLLISARKSEFQSRIMYMLQELELNSSTVTSVYELKMRSERRKASKEHWSRKNSLAAREESTLSSIAPTVSHAVEERSKPFVEEKLSGPPVPRTSLTLIRSECDHHATKLQSQSFSSEAPSTCLHSTFTPSGGRRTEEESSSILSMSFNGPPLINGGEATIISSPSNVSNSGYAIAQEGGGEGYTQDGALVLPPPILVERLQGAPMDSESIPIESGVEKGSFLGVSSSGEDDNNAHGEDEDDNDKDKDEEIEDLESLLHRDPRPNQEPGDVGSRGDEDDGGKAVFVALPQVGYSTSEEATSEEAEGPDPQTWWWWWWGSKCKTRAQTQNGAASDGGQNGSRATSTARTVKEMLGASKPSSSSSSSTINEDSSSQCAHRTEEHYDGESPLNRHTHHTIRSGPNHGKEGRQHPSPKGAGISREDVSSSGKDSADDEVNYYEDDDENAKEIPHGMKGAITVHCN